MLWQQHLANGFRTAKDLLNFLDLPENLADSSAEILFKTKVPLSFAKRMKHGDPNDPLLKQVLATKEETYAIPGYCSSPLKEQEFNPVPGLIHKYQNRVLLISTGACPIHCRYCFRREFPYDSNNPGQKGWDLAIDYIAKHPLISEVILSGGDPLLLTDKSLFSLIDKISNLKHVDTLRIHTRIPIVLPERITLPLFNGLAKIPLKLVIVLHTNHPQEIDDTVINVCKQLLNAGCLLLNQAVILRGINDDATILTKLCRKLFACGVLPYYLHVLDKVNGSAHFECATEQINDIYEQLQSNLPGYLVPKLVKEVPGVAHKVLMGKD